MSVQISDQDGVARLRIDFAQLGGKPRGPEALSPLENHACSLLTLS